MSVSWTRLAVLIGGGFVVVGLGVVTATPGALERIPFARPLNELLHRHTAGDSGDLEEEDKRLNDLALRTGERLLSAYETPWGKVWIITEADRSATTILHPEEVDVVSLDLAPRRTR